MPDINMMGGDMMGGDRPAMPTSNRPDSHEAAMARADLYKCATYSFKLFKMIQEGQELEGWVQAKITKAADYIASVFHYMEYEMKFNEYGKKLDDSDIYTEAVKQQFVQKLTEARIKLEKLKRKNIKDLDEGSKPDFLDMDKDGDKKEPMKRAIRQKKASPVKEAAKPDFLDMDKDGDKKEPMKQAIRQKKTEAVRVMGRTGEGEPMKRMSKGTPGAAAHRGATATMTKQVRAAGKRMPKDLDVDVSRSGKYPDKQVKKYDSKDVEKTSESVKAASTRSYSAKKAAAGKDIGKPGKQFSKIATSAGKQYGSKERGEKVAGAVLSKLRKK